VNEWKVIFATVLIFGTGVISGGLLVNYADVSHLKVTQTVPAQLDLSNSVPQSVSNSLARSTNAPRGHMPEILSKQFVDRLEKELQLTLGQRADIEKIIADGQDEMRKAVQSVRQDARQKIREKLTDPQKKQFDDLFKQAHPFKKTNNSTNAPPVLVPTNASPAV
jgi:Spy/CpxP family protein refolding chaperone